MRNLKLLAAGLAAAASVASVTACAAQQSAVPQAERQPQRSFWSQLHPDAGGTGQYLFDSLDDITPGARPSGAFRPAAALVEGTVVGVEPGIAYASDDDSPTPRVVPYESAEAAIRWASVVVRVDKVLAGKLGRGHTGGQIRLRVEQPTGTTLDGLRQSLGTAGRGLFYVDSALARAKRRAASPQAQAYQASVHIPIGQGVFIEEKPGAALVAPLTDENRAAQLLGDTGEPAATSASATPSATSASASPSATADAASASPSARPASTGASPRSTATGASPQLKAAADSPLARLRGRAQRSACETGTATDRSSC
ncbi:hypothetical protein [Nonomuraea rhodomycinica]|uniref:Uncharacterized protein n=1 Tax=Nonomuraea rhodomycinica TaxID=1712872 RepID=A0A7Y6IYH1_9ACTN|nr:hypothetical protein [Nonomuraea rhodomycinica]NUW46348.1 hypothetical protein [Nonomuraea rhodomycinica]